ncbi:MAG: 50S ribosome-binding GTPase [Lactobacillaceae bacterium]|jgi:guanylate kinase|nr:50S ribosome-binding GTPase [Lactobacillaceae bacterium]
MEKRVIVITGASGAGKTTVANYLTDKYELPKVITHTTRRPRGSEKDGVDYYFEDQESFEKNHFIERVEFSGKKYGSSHEGLDRAFEQSQNTPHPGLIVIVVDTVGAITYKNELGSTADIWFITTSDFEEFKGRLVARGDKPEEIEARTQSEEFERDMVLPAELQEKASIIYNDAWDDTTKRVDELFKKLLETL